MGGRFNYVPDGEAEFNCAQEEKDPAKIALDGERCDQEVADKGKLVFTTHTIRSIYIEAWVKKIAQESRQRVDWHWYAGRAVVIALGDVERVREVVRANLPVLRSLYRQAVGGMGLTIECAPEVGAFITDDETLGERVLVDG